VARGQRNVSPALAKRAEEVSGGRFHKELFIWPELANSPCTRCRLQAAGVKQSIQLETIQKSEDMP